MKQHTLDDYFNKLVTAGYVPPSTKTPKNGADKIMFFVSMLNFIGSAPDNDFVQKNGAETINFILMEIPKHLIMGYFGKFFHDDAKNLTPEGWLVLLKVAFSENTYQNGDVIFPTLLLNEFPNVLFVKFLKHPGGFNTIIYKEWFWFFGRYFGSNSIFLDYSEEEIVELMMTGELKSPVSGVTFNFNNDTIEVIGKDQTLG